MAGPQIGLALVLLPVVVTLVVTVLLALSPPYVGVGGGFAPSTLWLPLQTAVFRRAVVNTAALALGVGSASLLLGWLWARLGMPHTAAGRGLMFLPVCLSSAAAGLLWRPWLEPGLVLAQAELNLLLTGVVLVWQATPAVAGWLAWRGADLRGLLQAALIPLLLVLLNDGLLLTLTGGEPFNAAQTWASWSLHGLWVTRNWGEAAAMRGSLALGVGLIMALGWLAARRWPPGAAPRRTSSKLGLLIALLWSLGPFIGWLPSLAHAPLIAWAWLWQVAAPLWFVWWAVVIGTVGYGAARMLRQALTPRPFFGWLGVALIPLWSVALAYLRVGIAWLGFGPLLIIPWGVSVALIGLGLPRAARTQGALVGVALLLLAHGFGTQLVLDAPAWWTLPAVGMSRYLATGAPTALAWALLLHAAATFGAVWLAAASIRPRERRPAPKHHG